MSLWATAAAGLAGGAIAGRGAQKAAEAGASASRAAIEEQRRQHDLTRKDQAPWLEAGKGALGRYEGMLGTQGKYEDKIRSNIPGKFRYGGQVPGAYKGQSGDYFGRIKSDTQPGFQFGREEFEQYKDPGYDFRKEEGLKALERSNAAGGRRTSGYNTRSLMELGQNLASKEFGAARGRAMVDYESGIAREQQRYGRGVADYTRRTRREETLYGRGRQLTQDEMTREGELYQRNLRDYGLDVERERAQYGRDIDRYGRQYEDPLNREAALSNVGQTTAKNLGNFGARTGQNIGGYMQDAGRYGAAGQLGKYGAAAEAIGAIGDYYQGGGADGYNYSRDYENPEQQTGPYMRKFN